jgi:hypothetical protein
MACTEADCSTNTCGLYVYENAPDSEALPALDALDDGPLAEGVTVALELTSEDEASEDEEAGVDVLEDVVLEEVVVLVELG